MSLFARIPGSPRFSASKTRIMGRSALCGAGLLLAIACSGNDDGGGGDGGSAVGGSATGATSGSGGSGGDSSTGSSANGGSASGGDASSGGDSSTGGASGGDSSTGGASGGESGDGGSGGQSSECDASNPPAIERLGFEVAVTSDKLNALVYAAQPPGSSDWYLVDILGTIWISSGGEVLDAPFLDVSDEVQDLDFSYDERGLLSIAFPPDYATSGKFYVALVPTSTATADHDLILEYSRSAENPMVADTSSRKSIIDLEPRGEDATAGQQIDLNKYHNANTVKFGPDGMLYVGMGDGGGQCNSALPGAPQDISSPFGKFLRLDPSQPAPYAAVGNPFASDGDSRVWHYGVRNPFRFSFDSLTGDLYLGDVGQWSFEEISFAPAGSTGLNFGWPAFEAFEENPQGNCSTDVTLRDGSIHTAPIHSIAHGTDSGAQNLVVAIVGGAVYRGSSISELYGTYLFSEYYAGRPMGALYQCGDQSSEVLNIRKGCDANFPNDPCFVPQGGAPELGEVGAIVEGNDGELYLVANNNALLKIVPAAP